MCCGEISMPGRAAKQDNPQQYAAALKCLSPRAVYSVCCNDENVPMTRMRRAGPAVLTQVGLSEGAASPGSLPPGSSSSTQQGLLQSPQASRCPVSLTWQQCCCCCCPPSSLLLPWMLMSVDAPNPAVSRIHDVTRFCRE
jgi:hypothetical protein